MITVRTPIAPSPVSEVEKELWLVDIRLAEMSKQHSDMQTYARRWTMSAPRDRYEKRVGKANKFFGPMDWDEIIAFAQARQQDWVYDPWNFYCMLEHLSDKFPAKAETCKHINDQLFLAASELKKILETEIPDSKADEYLCLLEEQTMRFLGMIDGIEAEGTEQLGKAIKVTQELEKIGVWKG